MLLFRTQINHNNCRTLLFIASASIAILPSLLSITINRQESEANNYPNDLTTNDRSDNLPFSDNNELVNLSVSRIETLYEGTKIYKLNFEHEDGETKCIKVMVNPVNLITSVDYKICTPKNSCQTGDMRYLGLGASVPPDELHLHQQLNNLFMAVIKAVLTAAHNAGDDIASKLSVVQYFEYAEYYLQKTFSIELPRGLLDTYCKNKHRKSLINVLQEPKVCNNDNLSNLVYKRPKF